ncbi:Glucose-6-phosphate isomerase [Paraliobacillus sp. PM-2]|uniref:glucose-6-phosphate isomerase n=1 Tax=Paraliobacillus sp. PM-2 TaxID=1462524 RepID=UPI00061BE402|nr:glucose-6-phosphate isomerase [Paraliobacillus sp. PM-2]CQR47411.1 Glucose-6-phosphate isomerase [Paraliobacillus sp. PM-2]
MTNFTFHYKDPLIDKQELAEKLCQNKIYLDKAIQNLKRKKDNQSLLHHEDNLGWLSVEEWAGKCAIQHMERLSAEIRDDADVFVLIGVGGSNQAARAVIKSLQQDGSPQILYLGNNMSPHYVNKMVQKLKGKSVYVNVIAKNFETIEPGIGFRILRDFLYQNYGQEANKRIIVTGTEGTWLHQLSKQHGYTFLAFPENIGGRFSVLSNVGLFPIAVAGIEIERIIEGAKDMQQLLIKDTTESNIALLYATCRNFLFQKGYDIEMLATFEPQFDYFAKWWIQLFAESEGKQDKGIFPVSVSYSEDLHSVGQYVQDGKKFIFETFLHVEKQNSSYILQSDHVKDRFDYLNGKDLWDINQSVFNATVDAHQAGGIPCLIITLPELNAYYFGQLFYFFMFSCYLSGQILDINPFNQPGVEDYKKQMFDNLGKSSS